MTIYSNYIIIFLFLLCFFDPFSFSLNHVKKTVEVELDSSDPLQPYIQLEETETEIETEREQEPEMENEEIEIEPEAESTKGNGKLKGKKSDHNKDSDGYVSLHELINQGFQLLKKPSDKKHLQKEKVKEQLPNDIKIETQNQFQSYKNSVTYEKESVNDDQKQTSSFEEVKYYRDCWISSVSLVTFGQDSPSPSRSQSNPSCSSQTSPTPTTTVISTTLGSSSTSSSSTTLGSNSGTTTSTTTTSSPSSTTTTTTTTSSSSQLSAWTGESLFRFSNISYHHKSNFQFYATKENPIISFSRPSPNGYFPNFLINTIISPVSSTFPSEGEKEKNDKGSNSSRFCFIQEEFCYKLYKEAIFALSVSSHVQSYSSFVISVLFPLYSTLSSHDLLFSESVHILILDPQYSSSSYPLLLDTLSLFTKHKLLFFSELYSSAYLTPSMAEMLGPKDAVDYIPEPPLDLQFLFPPSPTPSYFSYFSSTESTESTESTSSSSTSSSTPSSTPSSTSSSSYDFSSDKTSSFTVSSSSYTPSSSSSSSSSNDKNTYDHWFRSSFEGDSDILRLLSIPEKETQKQFRQKEKERREKERGKGTNICFSEFYVGLVRPPIIPSYDLFTTSSPYCSSSSSSTPSSSSSTSKMDKRTKESLRRFRSFVVDKMKTTLRRSKVSRLIVSECQNPNNPFGETLPKVSLILRRSSRRILNDGDLLSYFQQYNQKDRKKYELRAFYLEDYDFLEQIYILQETSILIGVSGSGLSNMIFLPDSSIVVEIVPYRYPKNYFYQNLANLVDLNFMSWQNSNVSNSRWRCDKTKDYMDSLPPDFSDLFSPTPSTATTTSFSSDSVQNISPSHSYAYAYSSWSELYSCLKEQDTLLYVDQFLKEVLKPSVSLWKASCTDSGKKR